MEKGFTLIEVIIVIGILSLVAGFGLFFGMDAFRSYSQNYEENLIVSILQRARSQAMTNIDGVKHGACYDDIRKSYVLFDGNTTCTTDSNIFNKADPTTINWLTPVVFNQLDGNCDTCPLTITVSTPTRASASININHEGQIDW